jgi:hypothetical protein
VWTERGKKRRRKEKEEERKGQQIFPFSAFEQAVRTIRRANTAVFDLDLDKVVAELGRLELLDLEVGVVLGGGSVALVSLLRSAGHCDKCGRSVGKGGKLLVRRGGREE